MFLSHFEHYNGNFLTYYYKTDEGSRPSLTISCTNERENFVSECRTKMLEYVCAVERCPIGLPEIIKNTVL
jgi:hypothetical protein